MIVPGYTSTGAPEVVASSAIQFQFSASRNGVYYDLTGATVTLLVKDPAGTITTYVASVGGGTAISQAIIFTTLGSYRRTWKCIISGVSYLTKPIAFAVIASP